MENYSLVVESGADLPKRVIEKYGIKVVPMHIELNGQWLDDGTIPVEELFTYYERTGLLPKTSGCNPADFGKVFDQLYQEFPNKQIIHLAYSAETTCSYQSAKLAAENRPYITSINTKNVSAGQAVIVEKTAKFIEKNPTITVEEIQLFVTTLIEKVHMCFLPETLLYLKAGGRVNNPTYLGAKLLNLKPLIEVIEGRLVSTKKYRGSMRIASQKLLQEYPEKYHFQKDKLTLICGLGLPEEIKAQVEAAAKELGFNQLEWIPTGGVVSVHGGPSAFGMVGIST